MSQYTEWKEALSAYTPEIKEALMRAYIAEGYRRNNSLSTMAGLNLEHIPNYAEDIKSVYRYVSSNPGATSDEIKDYIQSVKKEREEKEKKERTEERKAKLKKFLIIAGIIVVAWIAIKIIF